MFKAIPSERFETFHNEFQGDTWDICARCGGKCEINKIGSLMPGEAEYISASKGMELEHFKNKYLDGIETQYGTIVVLKIKPGCPFLSPSFKCTIKDVKPVLCDVYPIVFEVKGTKVHFQLDPWCPIVRYVPELAKQFEKNGIPALKRIGAPVDWYRAVELYDWMCVDYNKLFALRANNPGYAVLSLEQVQQCQADDAPPPELKPSAISVEQPPCISHCSIKTKKR